MLQNYYDESYELFKEYEQEWIKDSAHFRKKFKEDASPTSDDSVDTATFSLSDFVKRPTDDMSNDVHQPKFHPEWAKKLFRKIAMETHPDRVSQESEARFLRLFRRASEAIDNEDHEELLSLALDLAIPIDIDGPALRPLLEKRVSDIKEKITTLEAQPSWVWGESFGIYHVRVPLLRFMLAEHGIEKIDDELMVEIQEREQENESG